jgi:putative aldouronate transport system permease protein
MTKTEYANMINLNRIMESMRKVFKFRYLYIMLIPGLIYFFVFKYIPIYGLLIAFKDYKFKLGIMGSEWIGLENFKLMFSYESFWEVFKNTIILSFARIIFSFPAPIILAIFLNEIKNIIFKRTIQTISYLPHFVSWVVLGGLFLQFLSPSIGPINVILKSMGIKPIYFMADNAWFRQVLVVTFIWKNAGWGSIIYLAALSNIDPQLYDSAHIDGANRMQRIIHITVPSLAPVITIMLIFEMGKIINDNFDQIFNMYNPAVYKVADVISTYTYRVGLVEMKYSMSTAIGLYKNIISFSMIIMAKALQNINLNSFLR